MTHDGDTAYIVSKWGMLRTCRARSNTMRSMPRHPSSHQFRRDVPARQSRKDSMQRHGKGARCFCWRLRWRKTAVCGISQAKMWGKGCFVGTNQHSAAESCRRVFVCGNRWRNQAVCDRIMPQSVRLRQYFRKSGSISAHSAANRSFAPTAAATQTHGRLIHRFAGESRPKMTRGSWTAGHESPIRADALGKALR